MGVPVLKNDRLNGQAEMPITVMACGGNAARNAAGCVHGRVDGRVDKIFGGAGESRAAAGTAAAAAAAAARRPWKCFKACV